jgi:hypothetical protein
VSLPRVLAVVVLLAAVAGCDDSPLFRPTAGQAGRACQAVEYDVVEAALGVRFDTANAAQVDDAYSCELSQAGQPFPDLAITLAGSPADELIFQTTVEPSGTTPVENLGRRAYQLTVAPATDPAPSGPGMQVGWLSAAPRIVTLRYTSPAGASPEEVAAMAPRLVEFARAIEAQIVTG